MKTGFSTNSNNVCCYCCFDNLSRFWHHICTTAILIAEPMSTHSRMFESQPAADPRFGAITGLKGELGALVVVDEGLKGASLGKVIRI